MMYRYLLLPILVLGAIYSSGASPDLPPAGPLMAEAAPLATSLSGQIEVTARNAATGQPIQAALVTVPELGLNGQTNADGLWWVASSLVVPEQPVTVTVQAPGYGAWTLQAVRVVADDTLYLTAEMGPHPVTALAPDPAARAGPPRGDAPEMDDPFLTAGFDQTGLPLPAFIRVRVTGYAHCDLKRPYEVRWVDFRQYLKNVLPSEWPASWARESLRAGAVAVKMYAWSLIARGGKWPDADVYDSTCDQVYRPGIAYASTNAAVDDTLHWRLTRNNRLFATYYRAYASQCPASLAGNCMGQWDSKDRADAGAAYPQILSEFYAGARLNLHAANHALVFSGSAEPSQDRVRVPIDAPVTPADLGAEDFTIEFWLKAPSGANMTWDAARSPVNTCGPVDGWLNGSVILDRDSAAPVANGDYGLSLVAGRVAFGVSNGLTGLTLCSSATVDDGAWHHVAVTRDVDDGRLRIWIDGQLDVDAQGPAGDISYADGRPPAGDGDTWLIIGGRKLAVDPALRPAFIGWLDELRLSASNRYPDPGQVYPVFTRYSPDSATAALYHFDDVSGPGPCTGAVLDSASGSAASGNCLAVGGAAPEYIRNDNPRQWAYVYLTGIQLNGGP